MWTMIALSLIFLVLCYIVIVVWIKVSAIEHHLKGVAFKVKQLETVREMQNRT